MTDTQRFKLFLLLGRRDRLNEIRGKYAILENYPAIVAAIEEEKEQAEAELGALNEELGREASGG